jgi:hypothetical protein
MFRRTNSRISAQQFVNRRRTPCLDSTRPWRLWRGYALVVQGFGNLTEPDSFRSHAKNTADYLRPFFVNLQLDSCYGRPAIFPVACRVLDGNANVVETFAAWVETFKYVTFMSTICGVTLQPGSPLQARTSFRSGRLMGSMSFMTPSRRRAAQSGGRGQMEQASL